MKKIFDFQRVDIFKIATHKSYVDYLFCCDLWVPDEVQSRKYRIHQTNFGRLRIFRENGQTEIVQNIPDDEAGAEPPVTNFNCTGNAENFHNARNTHRDDNAKGTTRILVVPFACANQNY